MYRHAIHLFIAATLGLAACTSDDSDSSSQGLDSAGDFGPTGEAGDSGSGEGDPDTSGGDNPGSSGSDDSGMPGDDDAARRDEVNDYMSGLPAWGEAPAEYDQPVMLDDTNETEDDVDYTCSVVQHDVLKNHDSIVALGDAYNVVQPGMLLQGKTITAGLPQALPLPRSEATLSIKPGVPGGSVTVKAPTSAKLQTAVTDLQVLADGFFDSSEFDANAPEFPAQISFEYDEADSLEEAVFDLGVSFEFKNPLVTAGLGTSFGTQRSVKEKTIVGKLVQPMYTISFAADEHAQPADFIADNVTVDDFYDLESAGAIGPDNLPTYVQSVTYGRIVMFTISTSEDIDANEFKLLVEAGYAGFGGKVETEDRYKSVMSNSHIEVMAFGGPQSVALEAIRDGNYKRMFGAIKASEAVPINFKASELRHPRGNAVLTSTTKYAVTDCTADPYEWVSVYSQDVVVPESTAFADTGHYVQAGDRVNVNCWGEIWAGVALTGGNGPAGWLGWNPDPGSPLMSAAPFSTIFRLANNPWSYVGNAWGWDNPTGEGNLQLGINDNTPNNGSGAFTCNVHVQRLMQK